jgi:glucose/arabinose dehydrogenase
VAFLSVLSAPAVAQIPDCTGISSVIASNKDMTGDLTSIRLATGLSSPVHITVAPGDDERLFVVEQPGRIRIIKNGTLLATPFLDINTIVRDTGNEEGLLSMAFHPDYQTNGMFWVYYNNNSSNIAIARYEVSADPEVADVSSGQVMITISHPSFTNHNGGQLMFSPDDGHLYAGTGDGGSGCDPGGGDGNGQSKTSLLGKLLRFNVSTGPIASYTTAGNPFDGPTAGADEIWSYGLRNPYRFSFDALTGNVYIGDVGQNAWEEVDCAPPPSEGGGGENYGWVFHEGDHCVNPSCGGSASDCNPPDYVAPITEFSLSGSPCSVIGGYVYRGCRMEALRGSYFYSDHCDSSATRSFRTDEACSVGQIIPRSTDLVPEPGDGSISSITSYGQDHEGELYLLDRAGEVFKIIPNFNTHQVSGPNAAPLTIGDDWTFEDLGATSDWDVEFYRIYRAPEATGVFSCIHLVRNSSCSNGACTWAGGDSDVPADDEAFYYLISGLSGTVESTAGAWSDGTLRTVDTGSFCPLGPGDGGS